MAGQVRPAGEQAEEAGPVGVDQQRHAGRQGQIDEFVDRVAVVFVELAQVLRQLIQLRLDDPLQLPQVLGAAHRVGDQLPVDHDVADAQVAGDVHPPILAIVQRAQHEKELELVVRIAGQAIVVAGQIEIVDVELVDELVLYAGSINDHLGGLGGRQHHHFAGRQALQEGLDLLKLGDRIGRQKAAEAPAYKGVAVVGAAQQRRHAERHGQR